MYKFSLKATGTIWNIDLYDQLSRSGYDAFQEKVEVLIREFESGYSRFLENSIISRLKYKTGIFEVREEFIKILEIYFDFYKLTSGAFTPLIGQLLNDIGYDKEYSFKPKVIREVPKLEEALEIISPTQIRINQPIELDFGGVGKGFLADKICKFLEKEGLDGLCIDAGGDMYFKLKTNNEELKMKVGLENPNNPEEVIGIYNLPSDESICSSSNNRRNWGLYSHIIHPVFMKSSDKILATWVVTSCVSFADTIATCLFFVKPEEILEKYHFEYLILYKDFSIQKSEGFEVELF